MAGIGAQVIFDDSVQAATLLAQFLPSMVALYEKIRANHADAGLQPVSSLLADVMTVSGQIEQTAEQQLGTAETGATQPE